MKTYLLCIKRKLPRFLAAKIMENIPYECFKHSGFFWGRLSRLKILSGFMKVNYARIFSLEPASWELAAAAARICDYDAFMECYDMVCPLLNEKIAFNAGLGGDLDIIDVFKNYITHVLEGAAKAGHIHVFEHFKNWFYLVTPMMTYYAFKYNHARIMDLLLTKNYVVRTPVSFAVRGAAYCGNIAMVEHLINAGHSTIDAAIGAAEGGQIELFRKYYQKSKDPCVALIFAKKRGHEQIIKIIEN